MNARRAGLSFWALPLRRHTVRFRCSQTPERACVQLCRERHARQCPSKAVHLVWLHMDCSSGRAAVLAFTQAATLPASPFEPGLQARTCWVESCQHEPAQRCACRPPVQRRRVPAIFLYWLRRRPTAPCSQFHPVLSGRKGRLLQRALRLQAQRRGDKRQSLRTMTS